jgi:uncharacterized protein YoaH (UPF0181 family)
MSVKEVLAELPTLTVAERQLVIRRALDLDELPLSSGEIALVEQRLAEHRRKPDSSLSLDDIKARVRSQVGR